VSAVGTDMRVVFFYAPDRFGGRLEESPSANWRCLRPAKALQLRGVETKLASIELIGVSEKADELAAWADLLVIQRRLYLDEVRRFVEKWRAEGKPVVLDLDDAYEHMPKTVNSWVIWRCWHVCRDGRYYPVSKREVGRKKGVRPPAAVTLRRAIDNGEVDAITVPSERLWRDWRKRAKTYLLRPLWDTEDSDWWTFRGKKEKLVVGWMGSASHLQSFVGTGLLRVLSRLPEQVDCEILIFGDRAVFEAIKTSRKRYHPFVRFSEYPRVLGYFDVAVAPLSGEYDKRRSDVKLLDYALKGLPVVASKLGEYRRWEGVRLVEKPWQWRDALKSLLLDARKREELAEAAQVNLEGRNVKDGQEYERAFREVLEGGG